MTPERQNAIRQLHESWDNLQEHFMKSYSDDNEHLERAVVLAERFIHANRNMMLENKQREGVSRP